MNLVFNFNPNTHNLWPIYEAITKYYPIGLRRDEQSILFAYPGIKALDKIVGDVIHKQDNFYKSWLQFEKDLSNILNAKHQGTTMGQSPSLSSDFILESTETANHVIHKKLCVNLSLAGKFYTIYGIDDSTFLQQQEGSYTLHYHATNAITVSPFKEFEQPFKEAQELLELRFPVYKFIPFAVHSFLINGLRVRYSDKEICSVYDALFNHNLDRTDFMTPKRGDSRYGYDEYWRIPNTEDQGTIVLISPPPPLR
jgi:hypothetical protein